MHIGFCNDRLESKGELAWVYNKGQIGTWTAELMNLTPVVSGLQESACLFDPDRTSSDTQSCGIV